ncbi:MAG: site-specific integrase [Lentisphaerae bacterium]|nr:site-specific integrase [Lentisphaerota bacterium]
MSDAAQEGRGRTGRRPKWPKIRAAGRGFLVDSGRVFSPRRRRVVADADAADRLADEWREERKDAAAAVAFEATHRAVSLSKLTDYQRADVLRALELLDEGRKGSLTAAVEHYLAHADPAGDAVTVRTCCDELLKQSAENNLRPRTLRDLKRRCTALGEDLGDRPIRSVTTRDMVEWIRQRSEGCGPVTRDDWRRFAKSVFLFANEMGYTPTQPVPKRRGQIDHRAPGIFTPAEVKRIMAAAVKHAPRLVPWLAVGLFAGLRTENELSDLDWQRIALDRRLIRVDAATAKKRRDRDVEIQPNLAAWLAPHRGESGLLYFSRRALRKVRKEAKVDWPPNGMRHSFGTYHLAQFHPAGKTALQLGHVGEPEVLHRHYKARVTAKDAATFWRIGPATTRAKVVRIAPVAAAG